MGGMSVVSPYDATTQMAQQNNPMPPSRPTTSSINGMIRESIAKSNSLVSVTFAIPQIGNTPIEPGDKVMTARSTRENFFTPLRRSSSIGAESAETDRNDDNYDNGNSNSN